MSIDKLQELKQDLIACIRYSSIYNTPCPEWVYKLIQNYTPAT